jgi:asparagine synthase (glutamine-hydrolysing)
MCGIAGAFDLKGRREFSRERLLAMTGAIAHRGPDDEQLHIEPGIALGNRRLAIIDIAGGRQPMSNETGDVWVAYEGELFNYPELRTELLAKGHVLQSRCDTESWVHLYEDLKEGALEKAQGQFAVSLWDATQRELLLARDRIGIIPLFYTEVDGWLLWGSEAKVLLASGMIEAQPDLKGIDYFFNFFVMSNTRTCFRGIKSIPPGHFLRVRNGKVELQRYWDFDFPAEGQERKFADPNEAVEEYKSLLRGAVRRRLVGEVPICSYLSGGLDSTMLLGLGAQENGTALPSFTISLDKSGPYDERSQAEESARLLGSKLTTVRMRSEEIASNYPALIQHAEGPVLDTSAACMLQLARAVRDQGYIVSMTGEGADESLAGYIWFKIDSIARATGRTLNASLRHVLFSWLVGRGNTRLPWGAIHGVRTAQQCTYEMMAHSRNWLYSPQMWKAIDGYSPYDELGFDSDRFRSWHPLNRSLYVANKIMLPGMLLAAKGDRAMRHASTEGRFPFLDESVTDFCTSIDPRMKLRGRTDKWLLRQAAKRVLPKQIANRPKTMFRANFSHTFLGPNRPHWVDQLLSPESITASGYFDPADVQRVRQIQHSKSRRSFRRFVLDMGLTGVISTQLWHHTFCGGGLADLPTWSPPRFKTEKTIQIGSTRSEAHTVAEH